MFVEHVDLYDVMTNEIPTQNIPVLHVENGYLTVERSFCCWKVRVRSRLDLCRHATVSALPANQHPLSCRNRS